MIQGRAQARNIDSKPRAVGFDNCALAAQRRVLQHNPSNSGPIGASQRSVAMCQQATFAVQQTFLFVTSPGRAQRGKIRAYSITWSAHASRVGDRDRASFCHSRTKVRGERASPPKCDPLRKS